MTHARYFECTNHCGQKPKPELLIEFHIQQMLFPGCDSGGGNNQSPDFQCESNFCVVLHNTG